MPGGFSGAGFTLPPFTWGGGSGTTTISSNTTLEAFTGATLNDLPLHYGDLKINNGIKLTLKGVPLYVSGTLWLDDGAWISADGADASGATAGAAPAGTYLPTAGGGGAGSAGDSDGGQAVDAPTRAAIGGRGGAGGDVMGHVGGTFGRAGQIKGGDPDSTSSRIWPSKTLGPIARRCKDLAFIANRFAWGLPEAANIFVPTNYSADRAFNAGTVAVGELANVVATLLQDMSYGPQFHMMSGAGGGGGGAAQTGETGGGGGAGGNVAWIACHTLLLGDGSDITADGGDGANGSNNGAESGGGGGGGGGVVVVICNTLKKLGSANFSALSGAAGTGFGGGSNGVTGAAGTILVFNAGTGVISYDDDGTFSPP